MSSTLCPCPPPLLGPVFLPAACSVSSPWLVHPRGPGGLWCPGNTGRRAVPCLAKKKTCGPGAGLCHKRQWLCIFLPCPTLQSVCRPVLFGSSPKGGGRIGSLSHHVSTVSCTMCEGRWVVLEGAPGPHARRPHATWPCVVCSPVDTRSSCVMCHF